MSLAVWSILFSTGLSIIVSAASSKESGMASLSFQHICVCVGVPIYLQLGITSHTFQVSLKLTEVNIYFERCTRNISQILYYRLLSQSLRMIKGQGLSQVILTSVCGN